MASAVAGFPGGLREGFQKCGEITTSMKVGQKVYALNCIFCAEICLQLEEFVLHVEEQHRSELYEYDDYEGVITKEEEELYDGESKAFLPEVGKARRHTPESTITITRLDETTLKKGFREKLKVGKAASFDVQDPLEEPAESELPPDYECDVDIKEEQELEDGNVSETAQFLSDNDEEADDDGSDDEKMTGNTDNNPTEATSDADKELTLAIIEAYKKQRFLWDISHPWTKNGNRRKQGFQEITNSVNTKMGLSLKSKIITGRIKHMRGKFRSQKRAAVNTYGRVCTPPWYLDKLEFLNSTIKYKKRKKKSVRPLNNEKPALPLPDLSHEQNLELIDIYKSFPCLWDMQHIGFRFKNKREEALIEMLESIKTQMDLDFTQDELQQKLNSIRKACTQEKKNKLQCERAQEELKPFCEYYEQISFLEENVGPSKCPYCDEVFNTVDQFKVHKSKHDGTMPFICPLCNHGCSEAGNYLVHLRRHTRDFPFECKECGKRYATSSDVTVHMRKHTGEKPYFCEVCGQSFRTWTFFDTHKRRHHKDPNYKCTICSKGYYSSVQMKEHMNGHMNVRDKLCNICGKSFTTSKYLRQHKLIHNEKKKYSCKICCKDFAQYAGLSGHMKSHGTTVSGAIAEENH